MNTARSTDQIQLVKYKKKFSPIGCLASVSNPTLLNLSKRLEALSLSDL